MAFGLPAVDRRQLLFGDEKRDHVFAVVGFSLKSFAIDLGLRFADLAPHVVFGLNLGHRPQGKAGTFPAANGSDQFVTGQAEPAAQPGARSAAPLARPRLRQHAESAAMPVPSSLQPAVPAWPTA